MSGSKLRQLRGHVTVIHDHFEGLYNPAAGEPFAMEIEFKITSEKMLAIKQACPWVFSGATMPSPDRAGTVTLSSTQPRVGAALTATLTDPNGSVSGVTWRWESSPNGRSNWATVSGAASATHRPVDGDVGHYLRAMASYTDGHGAGKSAMAVSADPVLGGSPLPPPPPRLGGGGGGGPVSRAPEFQDAEGNAITETARVIPEGAALGTNMGEPVAATDPDEDTLTYTLSGDDAASFTIDASTGQLTTVTALDHEVQASYTVTVAATDPSGATDEVPGDHHRH